MKKRRGERKNRRKEVGDQGNFLQNACIFCAVVVKLSKSMRNRQRDKNMLKKLIGDKRFYKTVLTVTLPIMVQNAITNFVNMLDNIMIGRVGTAEMTGVAIANQLIFIFNLCIFGAISGAGIFTAQFYGKKDEKGVADTMRFKLYSAAVITLLGCGILFFAGEPLIELYLRGEGEVTDIAATLGHALDYMRVILIGLLPFALVQCYAGTLRENGETFVPMLAGTVAVLVNLVCNYILIYGHLGAPALGPTGAAIATVLSRYVELTIVCIWTHTHASKHRFAAMVYKTCKIPMTLVKQILIKGLPLMTNEMLWSIGIAAVMQCYSVRGYHVVSALNISQTISNLFNVVHMSIGSSVAIIVGQLLGAKKMEEAVDADRKLIAFSTASCLLVGAVLFALAPLFPEIYKTTDEVKALASQLIRIAAIYMPIGAFLHASYFTLRSGGKTGITFLFDSGFICLVSFPAAYVLANFTTMPILPMYFAVQMVDLIKCVLGYILVKRRVWVNNIIGA